MGWFAAGLNSLNIFIDRGGPVLWLLALVLVAFWSLALERLWYLYFVFPKVQSRWVNQWQARQDRYSWFARTQREAWLSEAHIELHQFLNMMKVLVALFPMIGLLGTVTGMISVFDVLAVQGNTQPRLMAAGISMATLPTMAGMVCALVGMFTYSRINQLANKRGLHLERLMKTK